MVIRRALRWWPVAAIAASVLFGVHVHGAHHGVAIDNTWHTAVAPHVWRHHNVMLLLESIAFFGSPAGATLLGVIASAVILLIGGKILARRQVWIVAGTPLVALGITALLVEVVLKPVFDRWNGTAPAYPSGRTRSELPALVATMLTLTALARSHGQLGPRRPVERALLLVPLAVGLAIAAMGDHYITDVIGGWLFGAGAGAMAATLGYRFATRPGGPPAPQVTPPSFGPRRWPAPSPATAVAGTLRATVPCLAC